MDFSWLLGHARTTIHASPDSVSLPKKESEAQSISLHSLCNEIVPPCYLNPLLFNGHLQTFWTVVQSPDIPVYYKRHIFSAENPNFAGTFAVDFAVRPYDGEDSALPPRTTYFDTREIDDLRSLDDAPMLVTLHGLSGGSHEIYLRHVLRPLLEAGWEACVVNSRGCAMSKITTGILYNARATWDLRQMVKWLKERFPNRPLFGIGFSLGANILVNVGSLPKQRLTAGLSQGLMRLVKYIGEEGHKCLLKAAVVCSNPWNLEASSLRMQRSWLGREIYQKTMGSSMKALFEKHVDQVSKNTRVDIAKIRKITYLFEFDRELQGPTWGYPTEGAYYRDASSCDSLLAVKVPLLAINAEDDPIAVNEAIPYQEFTQNPYAVLCTTTRGGHLSWFESNGDRWFAKPACNFLQRLAKDVDFDSIKEPWVASPTDESGKDSHEANFNPMRRRLEYV